MFAVHDGREGFPSAWLEQPIQGVEVRIRDGLLQIRTPNLMRGYRDRGAAAAARGRMAADGGQVRDRRGSRARARSAGFDHQRRRIEGLSAGGREFSARAAGRSRGASVRRSKPDQRLSGRGRSGARAGRRSRTRPRSRILAACREGLAGYQVPRVFKIVDAIAVPASGKKGSAADGASRHVMVTGGSRGLGAAMIEGLLADGYRVSTCSRKKSANIEKLLAKPELGSRFFWGACEVGEAERGRARSSGAAGDWAGDDGVYGGRQQRGCGAGRDPGVVSQRRE